MKRFVASASAAEVMGLSEAIAQDDWICALWSDMVLGLCPHEVARNGKKYHLSYRSRSQMAITITCTMKQSAPVKTEEVTLIWQLFGKTLSKPQMFLWWVDGKAQVRRRPDQASWRWTPVTSRVSPSTFTVLVEAPEIMVARRQERRERERVPRVKSSIIVAGACGRNDDNCDTNANRDLTRNTFLTTEDLPRHPAIQFKDKSERSVLLLLLYIFLWRCCYPPRLWHHWRSVAIPETMWASLSLRQYKQLSSGLHTLSSQFHSPDHTCALFLYLSS